MTIQCELNNSRFKEALIDRVNTLTAVIEVYLANNFNVISHDCLISLLHMFRNGLIDKQYPLELCL